MLPVILSLVIFSVAGASTATLPTQCGCGYQDPDTKQLYTEALIVYFNETDAIDTDIFLVQDFAHKKEHGWNSVWKQGAKTSNANITNDTTIWPHVQALELHTDPSKPNHVVNGGNLRSVRRDIQYGSFRAAMRGAAQWVGGTALSMQLKYNNSESLEFDVMNMNDPTEARVAYLVNGEWPADDSTTNYTVLQNAGLEPWRNYINLRMDWNKTDVAFWIADNQTRALTKKDRTLPYAGQPLYLKTWSTGDKNYMAGPPRSNGTNSHVLWVRSFFNSSVMTTAEHNTFDERCADAVFCSTSDMSLRGSTAYGSASTVKWKQPATNKKIKKNAGIVAACCSSFGIFALINVFFRRTPWHRLRQIGSRKGHATHMSNGGNHGQRESASDTSSDVGSTRKARFSDGSTSGTQTPALTTGAQTPRSGYQTPLPAYETPPPWPFPDGTFGSVSMASLPSLPPIPSEFQSTQSANEKSAVTSTFKSLDEKDVEVLDRIDEAPHRQPPTNGEKHVQSPSSDHDVLSPMSDVIELAPAQPALNSTTMVTEKGKQMAVTTSPLLESKPAEVVTNVSAGEPPNPQVKLAPTKRINYLAGLVAVACLGVTLHHFCQTFWPWVVNGYGPGQHYKAEKWFKIFIGDYLLTQLWIGPFFLTATRFLSTNYLKNGNLEDIAKKELRRAPRLFVPIIIISLLEYFLISMDLTAALQWLPSVSWSTWPYVVAQPNFGAYINNMIELAFLMPNAIPEVVTHYCIGVLWTVPVQLQFTYMVLTATVLIRDIKNPWKRFGFYTIVIATGWYAKSWSACHWCGLLLSDLEATYKWRSYLSKRRWAHLAVCGGAFVCVGGAPLITVFTNSWSFDTAENGVHPDFPTGKPIMDIGSVYPNYNEPTFSILAFSIGLQILVELSSWVQKFLSLKVILLLHPHIMTIYLTHGFVMWTWGAWICCALSTAGVPYWANLIVTLITTYAVIFLLASIMTPLIEKPTQGLMRNLDRWSKDEPVPKRNTLAPFPKELVIDRQGSGQVAGEL